MRCAAERASRDGVHAFVLCVQQGRLHCTWEGRTCDSWLRVNLLLAAAIDLTALLLTLLRRECTHHRLAAWLSQLGEVRSCSCSCFTLAWLARVASQLHLPHAYSFAEMARMGVRADSAQTCRVTCAPHPADALLDAA